MVYEMFRYILRTVAKTLARPYVSRELPGWGKVSAMLVGDWRRDWLWQGHPPVTIRDKIFGYETTLDITRWSDRASYFLGRWYDLQAQLVLQRVLRPGDTVVDIGANRGSFSFAAASLVGQSGNVFSFEPNPAQCRIFRDEQVKNCFQNIVLHNIGLADENAMLELHVPEINSGEASFSTLKYADQSKVEVPVRIGDEVLPQDAMPRLIKIDVEGFEVRVIKGLAQTISRARPIIMTEADDEHLTRCGSSRQELVSQLLALNYHALAGEVRRSGGKYGLVMRASIESDKDLIWLPDERRGLDSLGVH